MIWYGSRPLCAAAPINERETRLFSRRRGNSFRMKDEMVLVVRRALIEHLAIFLGLNFEVGRYLPALLQGVTGSGKTEVYLRSIAAALEHGRGAVWLVPEISLTPVFARELSRL